MDSLAVVLASGGMDSCVAAAEARTRSDELALLHVTYGQLTQQRELDAFRDLADFYGVERRLVVDIGHLKTLGGSALVDASLALPESEDPDRPGVPVSYVPQRNGNLLFIAAAWAEVLKAESIWAGLVEEDSSGYPDCRRSFIDAVERAIALGNDDASPDPKIVTPLIDLTKADIVCRGLELGAPLPLTWSCYQREDVACGVCDSCQLRLRGFRDAGETDPIAYAP